MGETNKWLQTKLGSRIRERRETLRYSQKHVADMTGLSINTISKIERGSNVSIHNLIIICQALQIQPRDLLDFDIPLTPLASLSPQDSEKRSITLELEKLVRQSDYFNEDRRVSDILHEIDQPSSYSRNLSSQLKSYCEKGDLEFVRTGRHFRYRKRR